MDSKGSADPPGTTAGSAAELGTGTPSGWDSGEILVDKPASDTGVSEILPHLYLSNRFKANSVQLIRAFEIKTVLTVMDFPIPDNKKACNVKYEYIQMDDECSYDILSQMGEFNRIIAEGLLRGSVLVHCMAGVSRSVTAIASYLIATLHFTASQARDIIREGRPRAGPNDGFYNQLTVFEKRIQHAQEGQLIAPLGSLAERHTRDILIDNEKYSDFSIASIILRERGPHQKVSILHDQYTLTCKACSETLVHWSDIISHTAGGRIMSPADSICTSYFTVKDTTTAGYSVNLTAAVGDPGAMATNNLSMKVQCSCGAVLGESDAYFGVKCGCQAHVFPGYQILKEKVDVKELC